MQAPDIPQNEQARLAALQQLQILDTSAEERFDRLTRVTRAMFNVPIALVSLVDANRQWFKSRQGLDACETPRDISFCGHAILQRNIFHVADTRADARFADNPLVTEAPNIRMYTGAPLCTPQGMRVGTLCVIDDKPHPLSDVQLQSLRDLADCVERELAQVEYEALMNRLSEAESYSRTVMDHVVDGIMTLDTDGLIRDMNPAVVRMFGHQRDELLGMSVDCLLLPADRQGLGMSPRDYLEALTQRAAGSDTVLAGQRRNGSVFSLEVGISEVSRRNERQFVLLLRDVTARHASLQAQQKYALALERLHQITTSSGSFAQKIEQLLRLGKDVFDLPLAIASRVTGNEYRVQFVHGPEGVPAPGTAFALDHTYCSHCLHADHPVGFHEAGRSEIRDHPCYRDFALEAYIGTPLLVGGERYGTLNFSGPDAREQPFDSIDFNLIQLFSRWVGNEIGRQASQTLLQREIAHRTAILDSANFCIIFCDLAGVIQSFNRGAQRMLDYRAEDVVGRKFLTFVHDPQELETCVLAQASDASIAQGVDVLLARAREGGADEREWTYIRRDGSRFPALVSITCVRDEVGAIDGFVCIGADISERRRIEDMKSEFIATVSHELRTPLTSIAGSLGLICGGVLGELPARAIPLLQIALKNSERLIHLINDLLDIEKITAGKMQFDLRTQDVVLVTRKALEGIEGYANTYDVGIRLVRYPVPSPRIRIDEQRMQQILANFLSNAVKFSPTGSQVQVHVDETAELVRVSVQDCGIGIPAAFRPYVFQKFAQADGSDAKKTAGTGLGLAICKELAEQMEGRVGFESNEGQGSTFYVEFPVANRQGLLQLDVDQDSPARPELPRQPGVTDGQDPESAACPAGRARVLHVRDDRDLAQVLRKLTEKLPVDIEQTSSIEDARARLKREAYDLVLLDLALPDSSAQALLRDIRALQTVPRILLLTTENNRSQGFEEVDSVLAISRTSEQDLGSSLENLLFLAQNNEGDHSA